MKIINQYAQELEKMSPQDFTNAISNLPLDLQLRLVIFNKPTTIWQGESMATAQEFTQQVNYLKLAEILLEHKIL